jgi:hypothetical protein
MQNMRLRSKFFFGLVLLASACGSSQAGGSASISGVVRDQSAAAAGVQLAMGGETARTDVAGEFSLTVPAGQGALHVSSDGAESILQFGSIVDGMRLDLVMNVSGGSAQVESAEVELSGIISAIAAPDLTVAGKKIVTNSTTEVHPGSFADLKLGEQVRVEGPLQADGSILAREIEAGAEAEAEEVEIEGVVQSVAAPKLQVSGRTVDTNSDTRIRRGDDSIHLSDVKPGDRVHVRGSLESDSTTILARVIRVAPGFSMRVELDGTIDSITPPDHLQVSGLTVITDAHTAIVQGDTALTFADLKASEHVLVDGIPQQGGTILALTIRVAPVEPPPPPQQPDVELRGAVQSMSASGFVAGGQTVKVDAQTRFGGTATSLADIHVGDLVGVEGTRNTDGSVEATIVVKIALPAGPVEISLRGTLSGIGSSSITIAGKTIAVTAQTIIEQDGHALTLADLKMGETVAVTAMVQSDGSATASRIEVISAS